MSSSPPAIEPAEEQGQGGGSSLPMRAYLGMARGLWLLSSDYIYRSLEAGAWLPEEPFELTYCGCRESRLRRRPSHGSDRPSKNQPILGRTARGVLHGVRLAFSTTYLPVSDLGELVRAADGEVAAFRTAHVLMTDAPEGTLPAALKRMAPGLRPAVRPSKWLFDVVSGGTDDVLDDVVARALGGVMQGRRRSSGSGKVKPTTLRCTHVTMVAAATTLPLTTLPPTTTASTITLAPPARAALLAMR